jgi:cell division protein FtsB
MSLKKMVFFAIILASFFIINNFVHSIYNLWQKNSLITVAKQDLAKQEKENKTLKKKLEEVSKPEFVEGEARNKLFLGKSGEGIVVLPADYLKTRGSEKNKTIDTRPNWKKWWDTFF